ncbi:hypothetical protein DH2020_033754 [Rehmannia glutinosa]|uniref:Protein kinase domain-containing protein n=1 Tax=Rehmannia glutinosa TaxID=99300 RepID=A0ABR0VC93_REHGL
MELGGANLGGIEKTVGGMQFFSPVLQTKRSKKQIQPTERTTGLHCPIRAVRIVTLIPKEVEFFTEYGDANRYKILEIIGKGSYGVVCAAIDTHTGEKVAIKKITDIFEHNSDAIRILREIKLLRLLRHPDIVEIKRIMMPPSRRDFRDIYVVFELMESDLHQYTPAIDIWSIGCIFAEVLVGKPLFPGKSVVHQLDLITDLLGTPSTDTISGVRNITRARKYLFPVIFVQMCVTVVSWMQVRNEKARKYLMDMRKKRPVPFAEKFPNADPSALKLLQKLLAFDPKDRPSAEEALADPYFKGLSKIEREPSCQAISKSTVNSSTIPPKAQPYVSAFDIRKTAEEAPTVLGVPDAVSGIASKVSRPPPRVPSGIQNSSFSPISVLISPYLFVFCITFSFSVAAKPGRVVGPVLPYENVRHVNDSYDGGVYVQNAVLPPQSISPHCYFRTSKETSQVEQQPHQQHYMPVKSMNGMSIGIDYKGQAQQYAGPKMNPVMSADRNSNPYYQSQSKASGIMNSQIAIDAKLLQAQSQFVVSGPAAAAHGTVQLGLT